MAKYLILSTGTVSYPVPDEASYTVNKFTFGTILEIDGFVTIKNNCFGIRTSSGMRTISTEFIPERFLVPITDSPVLSSCQD